MNKIQRELRTALKNKDLLSDLENKINNQEDVVIESKKISNTINEKVQQDNKPKGKSGTKPKKPK